MRSIKFRAWNGESMEYGGFGVHANGLTLIDAPTLTDVTPQSPVMQFTGLQDKNSKDIYEGDILQVSEGAVTYRHKAPVVFHRGSFSVDLNGRTETPEWWRVGSFHPLDIEVIGNIHEQ